MSIKHSIHSFIILLVWGIAGCGSSATSSSSDDNTTSAAATTVPGDLVLSSPTESTTGASSSLSLTRHLDGDPTGDDYESKKDAMQEMISGDGDCEFTLQVPEIEEPVCYGPSVQYSNHPGGGSGTLPPHDVGLWSEYEGTEACAAAQMNYLIRSIASRVDNMIKLMGAAACAGKKAEIELPASANADPVDLGDAIDENVNVTGLVVTRATLERLADSSEGDPVYRTSLTATVTINNEAHDVEITLTHSPRDDDNSTYQGKISMMFSDEDAADTNCTVTGLTGLTTAAVILYDKSSATQMDYQVNHAHFCGAPADPFDENGDIDPTDKASATNVNGWGNDWNFGRFQINPLTGLGKVMFAWQAGRSDGATRVLNVEVTATGDAQEGDAWYGFGVDIALGNPGSITGMVCNWTGPGQDHGFTNFATTGGLPLVQYQKLEFDDAEDVFGSDTDELAITYAITNNCNSTGGGFTYESMENGAFTLDNGTGSAVTNDLRSLTDYSTSFEALTEMEDTL